MSGAQSLVLRSGEIVVGNYIKLVDDPHQVCLEVKGKTVCYPAEKVRGKFNKPGEALKYLMPKLGPDNIAFDWGFMEHCLEGEITLGKTINYGDVTSMPVGSGNRVVVGTALTTEIYMEKGNTFGLVYSPDWKKEAIGTIKAITQDLPDFAQRVDSLNKDWDDDRVIELLKHYNLSKYKAAPPTADSPLGVVVLYLKPTNQATSVKVIVDDTKEHQLTAKKTVNLTIPDDTVVKVCVAGSITSDCMLIRSARCCRQYLQVTQNDKKGKLEIEQADKHNAERYIKAGMSK